MSETETSSAADLRERIVEALKTVYDPEIPVDIYELGLIYKVDIDDQQQVRVEMTLTAPDAEWDRCSSKTSKIASAWCLSSPVSASISSSNPRGRAIS